MLIVSITFHSNRLQYYHKVFKVINKIIDETTPFVVFNEALLLYVEIYCYRSFESSTESSQVLTWNISSPFSLGESKTRSKMRAGLNLLLYVGVICCAGKQSKRACCLVFD